MGEIYGHSSKWNTTWDGTSAVAWNMNSSTWAIIYTREKYKES